jgi:acylglycerol lipase
MIKLYIIDIELGIVQISDKLKPPEIVISVMKLLVGVIPTWKIVPVKDIIEVGFKDPAKRKKVKD